MKYTPNELSDGLDFDPGDVEDTRLHRFVGAIPLSEGRIFFSVFAPTSGFVDVHFGQSDDTERWQTFRLNRGLSGFHVAIVSGVASASEKPVRYFFSLDGGPRFPDPMSRFQPNGVHEASEVVDVDFPWTDKSWPGVAREDLVIYELHIGTFTEAGTFLSTIDRLDELVELGVTAIELMPVAASAGRWNWGYDGVQFFAPAASYGTPDDFRRLVDAAHERGLAVILDVVYNHLGPEGNYWGEFGGYLSKRHQTVWGAAPNFDEEHSQIIRRLFVANAIAWLDDFHLDGLRVDAIHCMADESDRHVVADLSEAVASWSEQNDREVSLIAESNVYDPEMLQRLDDGGMGFDAQWCDDFLHSVFAVVRPDEQLCNREYRPHDDLGQTLRVGYVYEGTLTKDRSRPLVKQRVETAGLVYSIQNHDFIGNHPLGKRFHQLTNDQTHRAAAALLMLSPAIPMLFMGEEFACEQPFCFFVDFSDEQMQQGVVEGRRREYPQHDWSAGVLPIDPAAFESAKIGPASAGNAVTRRWYQSLIEIRKAWRRTGLLSDANLNVQVDRDRNLYAMHYESDRERGSVVVRLSENHMEQPAEMDFPSDSVVKTEFQGKPVDGLRCDHAAVFHREK